MTRQEWADLKNRPKDRYGLCHCGNKGVVIKYNLPVCERCDEIEKSQDVYKCRNKANIESSIEEYKTTITKTKSYGTSN